MAMPWMRSGLVKGIGIPAPSGERSVGCVDIMHQFEGDDHGGLLVRLFYPAQLNSNQPRNLPSTYAPWTPHKRYIKAYLEFQKTGGSGLIASIVNTVLNPRIPAVLGADVLGSYLQQSPSSNEQTTKCTEEQEQSGKEINTEPEDSRERDVINCAEPPPFPVIVFSHGLGGMRSTYSGICCDLASHGCVVASVEHRDRSACISFQRVRVPSPVPSPQFRDEWIGFYDRPEAEKEFPLRNKQVLQRCREAILALELLTKLNEGVNVNNMMEGNFNFKQFQGRLDLNKAAIMGHSFGGATTIQALSEDQRFLCGIALDCWMISIHRDLLEAGVHQPLLFINSFDFQWPENVRKMMKLTHPPQHIGASACTILTLKGTTHTNQSDTPFVIPMFAQRWTKLASPLDPTVAHAVNMDICNAFFKRYQLRDPSYLENVPNLDGGEGHSEHIIFGSNLDLSVPSKDEPTTLTTENETTKQDHPSANRTQEDATGKQDRKPMEGEIADSTIKNADAMVEEFAAATGGGRTEEGEEGDDDAPVDSAKL